MERGRGDTGRGIRGERFQERWNKIKHLKYGVRRNENKTNRKTPSIKAGGANIRRSKKKIGRAKRENQREGRVKRIL